MILRDGLPLWRREVSGFRAFARLSEMALTGREGGKYDCSIGSALWRGRRPMLMFAHRGGRIELSRTGNNAWV